MRRLLTASLLLAAFLAAAPVDAKWGADINAGAGPRLIEQVAAQLAPVVKAPEDERAGLILQLMLNRPASGIEAIKRFRNPELKQFFLVLSESQDWTVSHRALYALEYYGGSDALDAALHRLDHPEVRLRERAVIACIKLWDGRKLPPAVLGRLAKEDNFHVRRCLEALQQHVAGKLPLQKVYTEHVEKRSDGLLITPFLSGMNHAAKVAPGYTAKPNPRQGGGSASKLPPASRWMRPLLAYGEEVVQGTSLQPFANLRQNGTVYHVGHDVGASIDGAGYYAPADGVVKLIHTGSDMGTLIVVEHHVGQKQLVNSVYMHGGDTVFVKAGEVVTCGQLLGTMGMSYSIENGGHYAHLHYGMYPGPFSMTHNYGYKPVKSGLADWYDPALFLAAWAERTAPVIAELPPAPPSMAKVQTLLDKRSFGAAYSAAQDGPDDAYTKRLRAALEAAPENALKRVDRLRADGYPAEASRQLSSYAKALVGIPGAEAVVERQATWKKDKALSAERKAEKAFLSTNKKAAKAKSAAKAKALWEKLLDKYDDTPVAKRIRAKLAAG